MYVTVFLGSNISWKGGLQAAAAAIGCTTLAICTWKLFAVENRISFACDSQKQG